MHTKLAVSIHAPVWGANTINKHIIEKGLFQSTHPCGVRKALKLAVLGLFVSIHAPVWGAKIKKYSMLLPIMFVSIHAPVWGANTAVGVRNNLTIVSIHAPVWGANLHSLLSLQVDCVSIHAPVWGANYSGLAQ